MAGLLHAAAEGGADHGVLVRGLGLLPLLQLHDDRRGLPGLAVPGEDEVDAVGGLGDLVLDGHAGVGRDLRVLQEVAHVHERVLPGFDLRRSGAVPQPALEGGVDHGVDAVEAHVLAEARTGGLVDDHQSKSVYLVALPLAFSTGYFLAFSSILSSAAWRRSTSRTSARRRR